MTTTADTIKVGDFTVDLSRVEADGGSWIGEVVFTLPNGDTFTCDYEQDRDYEGVLTIAPLTAIEQDEPELVQMYNRVMAAKDELEREITRHLGDPLDDGPRARREAQEEDRAEREARVERTAA